jgi:hypothetical protein
MGEVYRARDPRLDRDVALKILPDQVAADPSRVRRFQTEAKAAGALNHPNILAVHDFGTHEGIYYVVSELLEGETLRRKLDQTSPLPVRKLIEYAAQIARGLAAAHERGIIHRDLKPENAFVTRDGHVKILDFGLAKQISARDPDGDPTRTSTEVLGTEPGLVMGTAGYMSPEQVRGQDADARSDIFSFGILLYEMASGHQPFRRDTSVETMNAVLKLDPPDLLESNPQLPSALAHIIDHCLEKDPHDRFQSARDLAFDLKALSAASGVSAARKAIAFPVRRWPVAAAVAVAVVAIAAASFWLGRVFTGAPLPKYRQLTFWTGTLHAARFAPDGVTILFSGAWGGRPVEISSTRLDGSESRPFDGTPSGLLAISRTGEAAVTLNCRSIGLFEWQGTLARVPLAGGSPREIAENVSEADWSPDGARLLITRRVGGRWRLESPPGKIIHEASAWISHPRFSPRGGHIAYIQHSTGNNGDVVLTDLAGARQNLSTGWGNIEGIAWRPDGKEVWFTAARSGGARWLHAVSLDGKLREILPTAGPSTLQDISADGRVLLVRDIQRAAAYALAPGESRERDLSVLDWPLVRGLTEDGRQLLIHESGEGAGVIPTFFLRRTDGSPAVKLTTGGSAGSLSPDGLWVATRSPDNRLMVVPTRAGETREILTGGLDRIWITDWSRDSKQLLFAALGKDNVRRLHRCTLPGGAIEQVSSAPLLWGMYVPNSGDVLAYSGAETPAFRRLRGDGRPAEAVPFLNSDDFPVTFSPDGRHLYIYRYNLAVGALDVPAKVYKVDMATGKRSLWRELAPADPLGVRAISHIWVTPDAASYAYTAVRNLGELYLVSGLR